MTTPTPRTYRLRVHDGDPVTLAGFRAQPWDGTGALFVVDSDPTSDAPYLESAPSGEGARVDPRTGRLTIGRYAVRVIDEVASAASTPSAVEDFSDAALYASRWSSPGGTVGSWNLAGTGAGQRLRVDVSSSGAGDAAREWTVTGLPPGAPLTVTVEFSYSALGGAVDGNEINLVVNGLVNEPPPVHPAFIGSGGGTLTTLSAADGAGEALVRLGVFGMGAGRVVQVDFDNVKVYEGTILGEGRVVTRHLADADARQQLLSRAAVLDLSGDGGATYPETLVNGYLTSLTLARALVWDLSVGDTLRDEADTRVWTEVTAAWPNASCLIGGPVLEPFPSAAAPAQVDQGPWTIEVTGVSADRVTARVTDAVLPQELASGPTKGLYASLNDKLLTHRALVLAQAAARPYFLPSATWSGSHGWFPRLRARLAVAGGGAAVGEFAPIAVAPFPRIAGVRVAALAATDAVVGLFGDATFLLDWPSGGFDTQGRPVPAQPAVGAAFDLRVYPLDVSPRAPLHVSGHPVDLKAALLTGLGKSVNAASVASTKAALGSLLFALRITDPPTLGETYDLLEGPAGFAAYINDQNEYVFVPTRVRPGAAARTVTLADLRAPVEGPTFALEEKTAIAGVTYALRRFATWADAETDGERPMDGLVAIESRIVGERAAGDAVPYGAKELLYTVPGTVLTGAGGTRDLQAWCDSQAVPLVDRYGRGAVTTTLHVLDSAASLLGDELTLALPHRPGAAEGQTPVAQRGTPEAVQVVGATRRVAGWDLEVVAVGVSAAAAPSTALPEPAVTVPVPAVTVAASGASPTTVATLTVTNAAAVSGAGLGARAESLVQSGAPSAATHGADLGWQDVASDATWDSPAAPAGATVWMRARAESLDGRVAGAWGAWTSVALGTITDGGGDVPGGASGAPGQPSVSLTFSGAGLVTATVRVDARTATVKVVVGSVGLPSAATVRAASPITVVGGVATVVSTVTVGEGAPAFAASYGYDSVGNESQIGTATVVRGTAPPPGVAEGTPGDATLLLHAAPDGALASLVPTAALSVWRWCRYHNTQAVLSAKLQAAVRGAAPGAELVAVYSTDDGATFEALAGAGGGPVVSLGTAHASVPRRGAWATPDAGALGEDVLLGVGTQHGDGATAARVGDVWLDLVSGATPPGGVPAVPASALLYRWKASDLAALADGTAVGTGGSVWTTTSGSPANTLNQATSGNRPVKQTRDGRPVVRFTRASTHYLTLGTTIPMPAAGVVMYVVARLTSVAFGSQTLWDNAVGSGATNTLNYKMDLARQAVGLSGTSTFTPSNTDVPAGQVVLLDMAFDHAADTVTFGLNGVDDGTVAVGATAFLGWAIFGRHVGTTAPTTHALDADVYDLLLFTPQTAGEKADTRAALLAEYGL